MRRGRARVCDVLHANDLVPVEGEGKRGDVTDCVHGLGLDSRARRREGPVHLDAAREPFRGTLQGVERRGDRAGPDADDHEVGRDGHAAFELDGFDGAVCALLNGFDLCVLVKRRTLGLVQVLVVRRDLRGPETGHDVRFHHDHGRVHAPRGAARGYLQANVPCEQNTPSV